MSEAIMKKARGEGVEIQLAIWEGEGKPILCIHGLTANSRCWEALAGTLAPKYRVLAMDLRGRGLSEKPPSGYSVARHAKDVLAVIDDLKLEQAVIMGHSLGAIIAMAFGAEYPERVDRLILIDAGGKVSEEQMTKFFAGIKPSLDRLGKVFPSFEAYVEPLKQVPFNQPWSPALEAYFRYEAEEVEGGVRSRIQPGHIQEEILNNTLVDVVQFYPKITRPVLILRATEGLLAEDDYLLPTEAAQRMVREMPNARCVDVEGANHYTIIFKPNEVRDRAIDDFLSEP
ncbi:MAG: alpha/beta hydrolase [Deltaproteobacteria bacterium]|nr:alpha/beta hydrolase [Deltaproteobacteria bacterium]MBW2053340.1 alpha/beta hydrolase [Deltaproteobacteria bacterium]MBW2141016.1 alpha/beta hydrolase [Deltaproteobacteria bacterium]MBW2322792.1 alpha/beta hydrolase [Deltaproteobacteria bacterium]